MTEGRWLRTMLSSASLGTQLPPPQIICGAWAPSCSRAYKKDPEIRGIQETDIPFLIHVTRESYRALLAYVEDEKP